MKGLFLKFYVGAKSLRQEMVIAFGLVVLTFIVFLCYLFPGVSQVFQHKAGLPLVIIVLAALIILGFLVVAQMIEPVIRIAKEAKKMAAGDYDRKIQLKRNDEIGELGSALNRMSEHIKENLTELKVFSEKTEEINVEINKRILTLSSLIQISNLVSQNARLDEVIKIGVQKCLASGGLSFSCLLLGDQQRGLYRVRAVSGSDSVGFNSEKELHVQTGQGALGKILANRENVLIDGQSECKAEAKEFQSLFGIKNAIVAPIVSKQHVFGFLVAGNTKEQFVFSSVDIELIDLISKQISIAIENDLLAAQLERLEIHDKLTGLFNRLYMENRLHEEIKRAIRFQRPCAFVLLTIDHFNEYRKSYGHLSAENVLMKVGDLIKEGITEVDKVGRFGDHDFAIIFPEKNKRQSIELTEDIKKKVACIFAEEDDVSKQLTCTGIVTENPLDGMSAQDLIVKGEKLLNENRDQGKDQIFH